MTPSTLVAYATKHGSTREVADSLATSLREQNLDVETLPAAQVDDLSPYDGVVVGGSLYTGRWHPDALDFLKRHRRALESLPVAVFATGPRTMEAQDVAESRAQLDRALAKVPEVDPLAVTIFGGVLDPRKLRFPFNRMPATDARDWDAVNAWARDIAQALSGTGNPHQNRGISAASFRRRTDEDHVGRGEAAPKGQELAEGASAATEGVGDAQGI